MEDGMPANDVNSTLGVISDINPLLDDTNGTIILPSSIDMVLCDMDSALSVRSEIDTELNDTTSKLTIPNTTDTELNNLNSTLTVSSDRDVASTLTIPNNIFTEVNDVNGTLTVPSYTDTELSDVNGTLTVPSYTDTELSDVNGTLTVPSYTDTELSDVNGTLTVPSYTDTELNDVNGTLTVPSYIDAELSDVGSTLTVPSYTDTELSDVASTLTVPSYIDAELSDVGSTLTVPSYTDTELSDVGSTLTVPSYTDAELSDVGSTLTVPSYIDAELSDVGSTLTLLSDIDTELSPLNVPNSADTDLDDEDGTLTTRKLSGMTNTLTVPNNIVTELNTMKSALREPNNVDTSLNDVNSTLTASINMDMELHDMSSEHRVSNDRVRLSIGNYTGHTSKAERCVTYCERCFSPILARFHNPPKDGDSRCYRLQYGLMCPPHGKFGSIILYIMMLFILWGVLWAITGDEALPGGNLFALLVLWVCAVIGGAAITLIKLPPLLGMLLVGMMLRNAPYINVAKDIDQPWSLALRDIAFTVILIRAGLGLDAEALRKLKIACLRLAFISCVIECIAAAIISVLLLDFPWVFGIMLGFVLGAVSPAVIVSSMLNLHGKGYGVNKGIPTLVIAAASVDDVIAITGFSVALGIGFSTGGIALTIVLGFVEVLIGVCFGIAFGIIMWYIPHQPQGSLVVKRSFFLFVCGLLGLFGSSALHLPGSGALSVLTMAYVVVFKWKAAKVQVQKILNLLWVIFQPFLFALIGAEILMEQLNLSTIGLGIAVILIALIFRTVAAFVSVMCAGLNFKEKCFISLAWLPKATVQAALGSIALDTAIEKDAPEDTIEVGKQILTIAVLSIIITAPLGAAAIALSGPRLLNKTTVTESTDHKKEVNNVSLDHVE